MQNKHLSQTNGITNRARKQKPESWYIYEHISEAQMCKHWNIYMYVYIYIYMKYNENVYTAHVHLHVHIYEYTHT